MTAPDYSDIERIGYTVHPAAERFDPYTDAELDRLVESVRRVGVLNPISVDDYDGAIVDGVHRARAVARIRGEGGKVFLPSRRVPAGADLHEYARANNDIRRHRPPGAVALAEGEKPRHPGGDPTTREGGNFATLSEAEARTGLSRKTLQHGRKVADLAAEEVKQAVRSGEVKVSDAAAVADLPHAEQRDALAKVDSGDARTLRQAAAPALEPEPEGAVDRNPPAAGRGRPVGSLTRGIPRAPVRLPG